MTRMSKYRMGTESPIGKMLVINIMKFKDRDDLTRPGSEADVENLKKVFRYLQFDENDMTIKLDLTKDQIIDAVKQFVTDLNERPADICCVCMMSHGVGDKDYLLSHDNKEVNPERDILEEFSNIKCKAMRGRPKMFLFQFCRGSKIQRDADAAVVPVTRFSSTLRDAIIAYSTVPGFVSYRDPQDGTWFTTALCKTFLKYARHTEVQQLFKLVSQELSGMTAGPEKQTMEVTYRSFEKDLFFKTADTTCSSVHSHQQSCVNLPVEAMCEKCECGRFMLPSQPRPDISLTSGNGSVWSLMGLLFTFIWQMLLRVHFWMWPGCERNQSQCTTEVKEESPLLGEYSQTEERGWQTVFQTFLHTEEVKNSAEKHYKEVTKRSNQSQTEDHKSEEETDKELHKAWDVLKTAWEDHLLAREELGSAIRDVNQENFIDLEYEHEKRTMNSSKVSTY